LIFLLWQVVAVAVVQQCGTSNKVLVVEAVVLAVL